MFGYIQNLFAYCFPGCLSLQPEFKYEKYDDPLEQGEEEILSDKEIFDRLKRGCEKYPKGVLDNNKQLEGHLGEYFVFLNSWQNPEKISVYDINIKSFEDFNIKQLLDLKSKVIKIIDTQSLLPQIYHIEEPKDVYLSKIATIYAAQKVMEFELKDDKISAQKVDLAAHKLVNIEDNSEARNKAIEFFKWRINAANSGQESKARISARQALMSNTGTLKQYSSHMAPKF